MFDTKSIFMYILMFGSALYLYTNIIAYIVNKQFASYSIEEICDMTIRYNKIKDDHYKLENYSFVLDAKRSLCRLDEKGLTAHSLFDSTVVMVLLMISLSILLTGSFGDSSYLVVYIGVVFVAGAIMEMLMITHKNEYNNNYRQIIQYVKDLYGSDVNGVLEDELVMYN